MTQNVDSANEHGNDPKREIRAVPVDKIDILNPRERNQRVFQEIVESIRLLGLKKPITVTPRMTEDGERYALVCGQGRLEAFLSLGQSVIPAYVIEASDEDAMIMSLVENIARRNHRPAELLEAIRILRDKGYDPVKISGKVGVDRSWTQSILQFLDKGEDRLIDAIETGRMPMQTAIDIMRAGQNETEIQAVLHSAYEAGTLRGKKLILVRRLIERRRLSGRKLSRSGGAGKSGAPISASSLVRAYNQEVERQRQLIRKADVVEHRLAFVTAAMANLLGDENFVNLLRAEGLDTLPKPLDDRIRQTGIAA